MKKYVNANIKSKEEVYHRLLDGEIFYLIKYSDTFKIFYDSESQASPFRFLGSGECSVPLGNIINQYSKFSILKSIEWWELPLPKEGLLVFDRNFSPKLIIGINKEIATTNIGTNYNVWDLKPITANDPCIFKGE